MVAAVAILLVLTAVFSWLNERWVRLPSTIGVTVAGSLAALSLLGLERLGVGAKGWAESLLEQLNFTQFVLGGILSGLLFAGALSLDAREVLRQWKAIGTLATWSTVVSTFLMGLATYAVMAMLGLDLPLLWCFLFGALISPTDPVAVLDMLKRATAPKRIKTLIAGESLFNDGIGIVLFLVVGALAGVGAEAHVDPTVWATTTLFIREAGGGLLLGAVVGYVGYLATRTIEAAGTEVLITMAMVIGGYAAASEIGVSGPLAMVVAGLIMSRFKEEVFSADTRELVEGFWEITDELLNVMLFTLIGLTVLLAEGNLRLDIASVVLVLVALGVRFLSVAAPMWWLRRRGHYGAWTTRLLTWGGLRGGIAIGLALSLPKSAHRDLILAPTFAIVLFTIVVQGLTVMRVVARLGPPRWQRPLPGQTPGA